MFLEVLVFFALGFFLGVLFGLVPGIHPNMIILLVPLFVSFNIPMLPLLAFIVSLAVSNAVVDFIPSVFLGAPEPGNELSVLPGHKMLMEGHGYDAVKLSAVGALGSVIFIVPLLPALILFIPFLYGLARPYIHLLLVFFVFVMTLTERTLAKKAASLFVFLFAGVVGILSFRLPVNDVLALFPLLSGFFGISMLCLQLNKKSSVPKQGKRGIYVSRKLINRSVVKGTIGGVFSGFLPGVGTSQIAAALSYEKNEKSFLVSVGAISVGNIVLSILSLWLIGRARSGAAVVIDQLYTIGFGEFLFIAAVSVLSCGLAVLAVLLLSRRVLRLLEKIDYSKASCVVIALIILLTFAFTGLYGLLLLLIASAFGVFVNLAGVKRGSMMGVLMLPTILFYAGF